MAANVVHVYAAPLINFDGGSGSGFSLTDRVQLRPLAEFERVLLRAQLEAGIRPYDVPLWAAQLPSGWALTTRSVWPSTDVMDLIRPQSDLRNALRGLRLFRPQPVVFPSIAFYPENGQRLSGSMTFTEFPPGGSLSYWSGAADRPYRLSPVEQTELTNFARKVFDLAAKELRSSFGVAFNRIDGMYGHFQEDSRIFDAVIALEAILLKDTEDDLSYKLALRGAHLLGTSEPERVGLFDLFRKAYRKRSKIVHGATNVPPEPSASEIVDLARRVLKRFVELSGEIDHRELIRQLDVAALRGDGTPRTE